MLEPIVPVQARDVIACALLQTAGGLVAFIAFINVYGLAHTVQCLAREHAFLSTLGITRAVSEHLDALPLGFLLVGHLAPIVAMLVLRGEPRPIAIQAAFTACQVIAALAVWLAVVSDFVRTNWSLNCF